MTNERKLELTLCGMLPYGLKIANISCKGKIINTYIVEIENNNDKGVKNVLYGVNQFPLLHSLDKLLTGILDEENSYYFNLNCELCDILEVSDCEYFLKSLIYNQYYAISINKAFEALEFLKQNHFNIYDLPSDMYIEKSTV